MSPTLADTAKLLKLKAQIEAMSPADQLRICAGCLERGEYDIAETLAGNVVDLLRARRLLRKP